MIGPNVATVMVACGFKTNDKEIMLMSRVTHCLDSILTKTTTTTTTTQDYSLIHSLVLTLWCVLLCDSEKLLPVWMKYQLLQTV